MNSTHGNPSRHHASKVSLESDLMPVIAEIEAVHSSSNSAEAKALDRLVDLDNPDQWVIAVTQDEKIDLEDLDNKIRERGYLV